MERFLVILAIFLACAAVVAAAGFGVYFYRNTHWYDKNVKNMKKAGAVEKQAVLPGGRTINYGEVKNHKPALLLIHGQMGAWQDYANLLPELSKKWHIYAVDVYGHGKSSHDESLYYIDVNGDDLIWFIQNVIGEKTVVSGHSNGALTAAYLAAYGKAWVAGVLLEDPPVFSTEGEGWENSFAYLDTYQPLHEYGQTHPAQCWTAYYLSRCYWGQLYMKNFIQKIADSAQKYSEKHPRQEVKLFYMPASVMAIFHYAQNYDFRYGEHFYDLSWNHGHTHKEILSAIRVPCIYLHAKESVAPTGVYLCAASKEQALRAVGYVGDNCKLVETPTSDHTIHSVHRDVFIAALNELSQLSGGNRAER